MNLNLLDYLIIGYLIYYFGLKYIKSAYKSMLRCEKHDIWDCVECEQEDLDN